MSGRSSKLIHAAVGAALALLIACRAKPTHVPPQVRTEISLQARSLPGMSIDLPPGKEDRVVLDYTGGGVWLSNVASTDGQITVRWAPREARDGSGTGIEDVAKGMEVVVNGKNRRIERWPGRGGALTPTILIDLPKGTMAMAFLVCGGRTLFVTGVGDTALHALVRRMLGTFVCQPDPVKEAVLDALPWTVTLPEGWQARDKLGKTFSNGASTVLVYRMPSLRAPISFGRVMEMLFTSSGLQAVVGELDDGRYPFEFTLQTGQKTRSWLHHFVCPQGEVAVLAIGEAAEALAAADQLVKAKGRCLNAGEAAPIWPVPAPTPAP